MTGCRLEARGNSTGRRRHGVLHRGGAEAPASSDDYAAASAENLPQPLTTEISLLRQGYVAQAKALLGFPGRGRPASKALQPVNSRAVDRLTRLRFPPLRGERSQLHGEPGFLLRRATGLRRTRRRRIRHELPPTPCRLWRTRLREASAFADSATARQVGEAGRMSGEPSRPVLRQGRRPTSPGRRSRGAKE